MLRLPGRKNFGALKRSTRGVSRSLFYSAFTLSTVPSLLTAAEVDLFDMPLDQLSQVEIKSDITSIRAKSVREQPGIISVVTSREIQEMGARDLTDVLMQVPGFSMSEDVNSMVGLTFRGINAQEGKALLILDGIEVNEPLYGSLPMLDHIPADAIEQVEIIRGPGSAAYGGTASLSVIRVTTKGASMNGGYATITPSYASDRWGANYASGIGETKGDWRFSVNASYTDNYISNRRYVAQDGTSVDLTHRSDINPLLLDMGVGWKDLEVRIIYDRYRYLDQLDYGTPLSDPNNLSFDSFLTSAKYDLHPASWLKITPQFTYRNQQPWDIAGQAGDYKFGTDRYQGDLTALAEVTDNSSLLTGVRFQRDSSTAK